MKDDRTARERILGRLQGAAAGKPAPRPEDPPPTTPATRDEMIRRLKARMEAVRGEVHVLPAGGWTDALKDLLRKRGVSRLVIAPGTPVGDAVVEAWKADSVLPALIPYDREIEDFKDTLFTADAAITAAMGAVADTGAIVLWPDAREPRLMSLVPPIHIAVLSAGDIRPTFSDIMARDRWADGMPTNAVLISGPSKTADIELVLAFGVHGPKELIVLILDDGKP